MSFRAPVRLGDEITQTMELASLEEKQTRSGPMVSAVLRRTVTNPAGTAIVEEQDILYLGDAPSGAPPPGRPAPAEAAWRRVVMLAQRVIELREDLPDGFIDSTREFLEDFPRRIAEYEQILNDLQSAGNEPHP